VYVKKGGVWKIALLDDVGRWQAFIFSFQMPKLARRYD
jgi:hypothetical protein